MTHHIKWEEETKSSPPLPPLSRRSFTQPELISDEMRHCLRKLSFSTYPYYLSLQLSLSHCAICTLYSNQIRRYTCSRSSAWWTIYPDHKCCRLVRLGWSCCRGKILISPYVEKINPEGLIYLLIYFGGVGRVGLWLLFWGMKYQTNPHITNSAIIFVSVMPNTSYSLHTNHYMSAPALVEGAADGNDGLLRLLVIIIILI